MTKSLRILPRGQPCVEPPFCNSIRRTETSTQLSLLLCSSLLQFVSEENQTQQLSSLSIPIFRFVPRWSLAVLAVCVQKSVAGLLGTPWNHKRNINGIDCSTFATTTSKIESAALSTRLKKKQVYREERRISAKSILYYHLFD